MLSLLCSSDSVQKCRRDKTTPYPTPTPTLPFGLHCWLACRHHVRHVIVLLTEERVNVAVKELAAEFGTENVRVRPLGAFVSVR